MKPVTDPRMLEMLEAQEAPTGLMPVDDPAMLQQLESPEPAPSYGDMASSAGNFLQQGYQGVTDAASSGMLGVRNAIVGDQDRDEDLPEVPLNIIVGGKTIPIQDKLGLAQGDPVRMAALFKRYFKDAPVDFDNHGNPITELNGKRYFLNKPGASIGDVAQTGTNIVNEMLGAMTAGRLGGAAGGTIGRLAGSGLGAAAASIGENIAADQEIDAERAAMIAFLGVAGEGVLPLAGLLNKFRPGSVLVNADGMLTDKGTKVLTSAGIDPLDVTPDFLAAWARQAENAASPDASARMAEARMLPEPVELTQRGIDWSQESGAFESAAIKGTRGDSAAATMRAAELRKQEQLQSNAEKIGELIGGRRYERTQGMQAAQDRLVGDSERLKTAIDAAYETARKKGTSVITEGINALVAHVQPVFTRFNPRTAPQAYGLAQDLKTFTGEGIAATKVKTLENWRQQVTELTRGSDKVEASAARDLLKKYDEFMTAHLDDALVRGDDGAVEAFRNARRLRREFFKRYESDDILEKIITRNANGELPTPEEALGMIFTASGLGAKNHAVNALRHMRNVLGAKSPEWGAMRAEAFMRLLPKGGDFAADMSREFSGAKFATAVDNAMRDQKSLLKTLFSTREIGLINRFRRVAVRATEFPPGTVNHSNTMVELERLAGQFGALGRAAQIFIGRFGKAFAEQNNAINARAAAKGVPAPAQPLVPAGVGGAVGSSAGVLTQ